MLYDEFPSQRFSIHSNHDDDKMRLFDDVHLILAS